MTIGQVDPTERFDREIYLYDVHFPIDRHLDYDRWAQHFMTIKRQIRTCISKDVRVNYCLALKNFHSISLNF